MLQFHILLPLATLYSLFYQFNFSLHYCCCCKALFYCLSFIPYENTRTYTIIESTLTTSILIFYLIFNYCLAIY